MLNSAILQGRLCNDPELRQTPSGTSVCNFRLAVERTYQPKGQEKQTDFINIVTWRSTAEFVGRYFRKGQLVAVQGSIQTRQYTDKDGNKRTSFDVVADNAFFAEKKADSGDYKQGAGHGHSLDVQGDFEEIAGNDELPF